MQNIKSFDLESIFTGRIPEILCDLIKETIPPHELEQFYESVNALKDDDYHSSSSSLVKKHGLEVFVSADVEGVKKYIENHSNRSEEEWDINNIICCCIYFLVYMLEHTSKQNYKSSKYYDCLCVCFYPAHKIVHEVAEIDDAVVYRWPFEFKNRFNHWFTEQFQQVVVNMLDFVADDYLKKCARLSSYDLNLLRKLKHFDLIHSLSTCNDTWLEQYFADKTIEDAYIFNNVIEYLMWSISNNDQYQLNHRIDDIKPMLLFWNVYKETNSKLINDLCNDIEKGCALKCIIACFSRIKSIKQKHLIASSSNYYKPEDFFRYIINKETKYYWLEHGTRSIMRFITYVYLDGLKMFVDPLNVAIETGDKPEIEKFAKNISNSSIDDRIIKMFVRLVNKIEFKEGLQYCEENGFFYRSECNYWCDKFCEIRMFEQLLTPQSVKYYECLVKLCNDTTPIHRYWQTIIGTLSKSDDSKLNYFDHMVQLRLDYKKKLNKQFDYCQYKGYIIANSGDIDAVEKYIQETKKIDIRYLPYIFESLIHKIDFNIQQVNNPHFWNGNKYTYLSQHLHEFGKCYLDCLICMFRGYKYDELHSFQNNPNFYNELKYTPSFINHKRKIVFHTIAEQVLSTQFGLDDKKLMQNFSVDKFWLHLKENYTGRCYSSRLVEMLLFFADRIDLPSDCTTYEQLTSNLDPLQKDYILCCVAFYKHFACSGQLIFLNSKLLGHKKILENLELKKLFDIIHTEFENRVEIVYKKNDLNKLHKRYDELVEKMKEIQVEIDDKIEEIEHLELKEISNDWLLFDDNVDFENLNDYSDSEQSDFDDYFSDTY